MRFDFIHWHSLKSRVTFFTLVVFLIGIWSLAFYASRMLRQDMEHLLGEQQYSTVSLAAEQVNSELTDRLTALKIIAGEMTPALLGNTAALHSMLKQRPIFQNLFNGGVLVLRLDGTAIAEGPRPGQRIGVNYMDVDAVVAALSEGRTMVSRPLIGKTLQAPVFGMVTPIRDAQGQVIGALFGVINLGKPNFLDKIMASRYGRTGGYLLVAPQHQLFVTATDKSRTMLPTPALGVNPLLDRYMQGYEGHGVSLSSRGIEELTAVKSIPVAGWFLGLVQHTENVFAPIRIMQQRMLLAALFLSVLAGGLTWWLMSWMLRRQLSPMLAAARTMASLSDTMQPVQPLPVAREDEIGELISSFNRLISTLGQREALLKQILDTSSVAIFLIDMDGRITQANKRMAEMFKCSLDTLHGHEYVTLLHPTERESGRKNMQALMSSAVPSVDVDRLYWRPDQTQFWGHLTGKRFYDANGEERGLIGVIADITESRKAEEKLHLDAGVFTHAHEGIMITSADGTIIDVNAAFSRITGYEHDDLLGKNPRTLSSGRQGKEFYAKLWGDLKGKGHWYGEVWNRRKSGEVYAEMLTISAVRDAQGQTRQYVALFSDITERKQMEDQVRQLAFYDALTQLPNRRLLHDRLRQTMTASKRTNCYGAVMVLDLDNFKSLNDTHGHLVGDLLLIEVARRLTACVRDMDTVARFGGDEFVVMLSNLSSDKTESTSQAGSIAEKIRLALSAPYRLTVSNEGKSDTLVEHQCSASIGVVLFFNHDASQDDILKWADAAMYRAKGEGRNTFRFHD